ncbi:MAG: electron transfer flavoprotein subunit beta/FixA family protein [Synergistaceae bacterium]|nr:electron transfer flavoprotein subunit beta/FixA family protein [Synergistaceae bacterium]
MNILVCVKQVPDTTEIKIDPVTNTLIRAGVPSIVNTFDTYALEVAARLKDASGGETTVLSMGPPQAEKALRECLSVGADKAYLLSDRAFGGSDTLATSYIISRAIKAIEEMDGKFDVIFCGKQAIDGDTAQVGPEIAEHLGYPQVTYSIEVLKKDSELAVKRETEEGFEVLAVKTPCVITVTKTSFDPRYASIKSRVFASRANIPTLSASDISLDISRAGLNGSPTKVKKTFTPPAKQNGVIIREVTKEATAKKLLEALFAPATA